MTENIPIYELILDENYETMNGLFAVSFVNEPAIEIDFIALSKNQPKNVKLSLDSKKQILTGPLIIPNKLIDRYDDYGEKYFIKFTEAETEKIAYQMMLRGTALKNTTHQHELSLDGNYLVESWIVNDPKNDKANSLGFKNIPKGTLMVSYKVPSKEYWENEVISGNVRGFSLEGLFSSKEVKMKKINNLNNKKSNMAKKQNSILKAMKAILEIEDVISSDSTDSGVPTVVYTLADGVIINVDENAVPTFEDGNVVPDGEHTLDDGNVLVIENGKVTETKEKDMVETEPENAIAPSVDEAQLSKLKNKLKNMKLQDVDPAIIDALETIIETIAPEADAPAIAEEVVDEVETIVEEEVVSEEVVELEDVTITIDGTEYAVAQAVADYIKELEKTGAEVATELKKLKKVTPSAKPVPTKQELSKPGDWRSNFIREIANKK